MKKFLLSIFIAASVSLAFSQGVVFNVLTPADQAGFKPLELAVAGGQGWEAMPDLNVLANAITGELVFVADETAADSLGCSPLINGADVAGKIGVVWRGTCPFALKVLNVFNAGAIGVIIVNNAVDTAPFVPGGGPDGTASAVSIPAVMTDRTTGEALAASIEAGLATAYIGVVITPNNLRMATFGLVRSEGSVIPASLALNASEFSVPMGATVINDGTSNQTGVAVNATVSFNGTELYNETVGDGTIASTDTLFFALPTFSQASYPIGSYVTTYTLTQDGTDDFPLDNGPLDATFTISDGVFSFSTWNSGTLQVNNSQFFRPATFSDPFQPCINFRNANASRMRLDGIWFAASTAAGVPPLTGITLNPIVLEWNDAFVNIDDAALALNELPDFDFGFYDYEEDLQQQVVYVAFENQLQLEDNQRYLICVSSSNPDVFLGYGPSTVDYTTTQEFFLQPLFPLISGTSSFLNGFGLDIVPAFALDMTELTIGLDDKEEISITPFPNPTADYIGIPYSGAAGQATLSIFDLAGKMVKEQRVIFAGEQTLRVDMNGVPNGSYVFNLQFSDDTVSNFKVIVAR